MKAAWYQRLQVAGLRAEYTQTLHKSFYLFVFGISKAVVFTVMMLDAGYLMPDIQELTTSEIQKPVFRITQYYQ